ncbi:MAG: YihY/virulence factor BrkB family protein [Lentisphaeria bacterium]|nr:YihY/virulence factor BrkB family protein [Lentisphaeria bacterium]
MKFRHSIMLWLRNCGRIIKFSGKRYAGDQMGQQAVVLTYYTLFAIVPLAALLFGIAKGFGLETLLRDALYTRFQAQHEMLDYVCQIAERTLKEASGGVVAGVGVIALLWTVIWLIINVEKAFNVVWGLPPRRNILRKFSSYLSVILLTPILMVAISTFGMMLRRRISASSDMIPEWHFAHWLLESAAGIVPVAAGSLLFFFIYLRVPNTRVRWTGALVAGIITGICFQILQDSFMFLQSSVFSYNRLYGSFAILPLFLIWVNWSWQLILFGAEISFVHQHLRSGVFNETRRETPLRLRREHQLAILRLVFGEFENGSGPVAEDEISRNLRIPDMVMRSEIGELLNAGILCRSVSPEGQAFFLPGVPPEKFSVMDFMHIINGTGDGETPEFSRFEELFCRMEKSICSSNLNTKIHEL